MSIEAAKSPFPDDPARREALRRLDEEWERGLERYRIITMFGGHVLPSLGWSAFLVVFAVVGGAIMTAEALNDLRRFNEDAFVALISLIPLPFILLMVVVCAYHFYKASIYRAARAGYRRRREAVLRGDGGSPK